jgi:FkbM family methyltransferase
VEPAVTRFLKDWFWAGLSRGLSAGVRAIRRQPSSLGPDEWRAVRFSYSHYAEDLIVLHLLERHGGGPKGVYVDVGAFDPVLFSNTLLLRQHGWRGVNIEPNPDRLERFRKARPEDTNVCAAIGEDEREVIYLHYPTEGTNRFVLPGEADRANVRGEAPVRETPIRTVTLNGLLAKSLPDGARIDFLNVDCEGQDLAVLRGLDWSRWKPAVVAVEAYSDPDREAVRALLTREGYTQVAQTILTLIFRRTGEPVSDLRRFA